MKKVFIRAIVFAVTAVNLIFFNIACIATYPERIRYDVTINLASFNLRYNSELDLDVRSWAYRRDYVYEYLLSLDKDIICMQEVNENQYLDLAQGIGEKYNIIYYDRDTVQNPEGLAICYDKEKFTLIKEGIFWLSETPHKVSIGWEAICHRICVTALLKHNESGKYFDVYNVHLDSQDELARNEGIKLVMNKVKDSSFPSIVCGDMNGRVTDRWYEIATETMLDCQAVAENTEFGCTFNGWGENCENITEGEKDTRAIDFCFVSKEFKVSDFEILQDKIRDGEYYSDHFMVATRITFTYFELKEEESKK